MPDLKIDSNQSLRDFGREIGWVDSGGDAECVKGFWTLTKRD